MVVLLDGSPISTEEPRSSVRVTIGFLVTSMTKALLPWLHSFAGRPDLGSVMVVPKQNPVSELYGQFLQPHGLVFALTCTVNCGILYRQVCAFPNHGQSIDFATGGLQSSCRYISRMINGNMMHLGAISSLIANGPNSYENKVFLFVCFYFIFLISNNLKKTCIHFVIMGYCV